MSYFDADIIYIYFLGCALVHTHVYVDYVLVSGMKIIITPEDSFPVSTKVLFAKQNTRTYSRSLNATILPP